MRLFANTQELRTALLGVITDAQQPKPSRQALAAQLESIADKLGAGKPRKRKPALKPVTPRQVTNVGVEERKALEYVKFSLQDALEDIKREVELIHDNLEDLKADAKEDERELSKEELDAVWWEKSKYFGETLLDHLKKGLDSLAMRLEDHAPVTQEKELADAVQGFVKKLPKDAGDWPEGKGQKLFDDVHKAIAAAATKVPVALTKPSELAALRTVLENIAEVVKLISGKSIAVPKIPNALDPEDPRQLGFGFSASRRIASPHGLKVELDAIWRLASAQHPSRAELAEALYATASAVRR